MAPKLSRRAVLAASLGASQFALLERLGLSRTAWADPGPDAPIKLLVLYLKGGVRFYPSFVPMSDADVARTIPPPTRVMEESVFFRPADLVTLDGDSGGFQPLRIPRSWNPADPGDRGAGYRYSPMGYSWIHHRLGPTTAVVHGIDQGSFAHASAYVSAMCGIPSSDYRAPALVSVVANYLHRRHGSTRAIPAVAISSTGLPRAYNLPSSAAPAVAPNAESLAQFFSTDGRRHARWAGSDARTGVDVPRSDGRGPAQRVALTTVDALLLARTRALAGTQSAGTDAVLAQIHDGYAGISRTFANDVVAAVQAVTPTTLPRAPHLRGYRLPYLFTYGLANQDVDMTASCEWVLRLLKSDVTSVVYAALPEQYYDLHNASSIPEMTATSRAQLDIIARMLGEMKATPSRERQGKTLYDDTLVVVMSEFNRSWMRGPNQDSTAGWNMPDDHNPVTSVVLSGGGIAGNRQIGGFEQPSALGLPVEIVERDRATRARRPPKSADLVATVASQFGMVPDRDFELPGTWGVIQGLARG